MLDLTARNLVELFWKIAGVAETQAREYTFADEHGWDIGSLPGGDSKAYPGDREPKRIKLIVSHVTAVTGGFGVSKRLVSKWTNAQATPDIWDQIVKHYSGAFSHDAFARRLALWSRYRKTPYQQIAAPNGDVIANRRIEQKSWHGNAGGNEGVGFAVDCGANETLSDFMVQTGRASLRQLVTRMRDLGNEEVIRVAPHRAYSAMRRNDPGRIVWGEIVLPVVATTTGLVVDYEARRGRGRPVSVKWDPNATHDDRGRRITR